MTRDKLTKVLTDQEFAGMMRDFDAAGDWMREQLTLKRSTPRAAALGQHSARASQKATDAPQATDDFG